MKKKLLSFVLWITPILYLNAQGFHFGYRYGAEYPDKAKMPIMENGEGRSFFFHYQFKNRPWLWVNLERTRTYFQSGGKWETFQITAYDGMQYDLLSEFRFSTKLKKTLLGIRVKDPKRWYLPYVDLQVGLGRMLNTIEYFNLEQPQGTMPYYFSPLTGTNRLAHLNWYGVDGGDRRNISKTILASAGLGWSIPLGKVSRCPLTLDLCGSITFGGKIKYFHPDDPDDISPQPYTGEVKPLSDWGKVSGFYVDSQIYDPRTNSYHEDNVYYQIATMREAKFIAMNFRVGLTFSFAKLWALEPK